MPAPLNVTLSFSSDEAWALAQFVKRADRDTARRHAGDAQEADLIFDAWMALRAALARGGRRPALIGYVAGEPAAWSAPSARARASAATARPSRRRLHHQAAERRR